MARIVTLIFGLVIFAVGGLVALSSIWVFAFATHPSWSPDIDALGWAFVILLCAAPVAVGDKIVRIGWSVIRTELGKGSAPST